jgi:hypothetical protein
MEKRFLIGLTVCLLITFILGAVSYTVTNTIHSPYHLLRAEANENSTLIDLTTGGDFSSKPAGAVQLVSSGEAGPVNAIQFIFCGGSAADKTFSWKLYAWRRKNGPCEFIASGTAVLGTQRVMKYPHNNMTASGRYWADTLAITEQVALKTFSVADASSSNRVAKLYGDLCGYEWVYVEITNADGTTGSEAGNISVYYSYF